MKTTRRTERLAQAVKKEVSTYLLTEGHDGRFERVVITDCRVTADLRIARVYFTILGAEGREESRLAAERALERARKSVRRVVGQSLRAKYTPEIFFLFDETLEQARRIEALLERVRPATEDESEEE